MFVAPSLAFDLEVIVVLMIDTSELVALTQFNPLKYSNLRLDVFIMELPYAPAHPSTVVPTKAAQRAKTKNNDLIGISWLIERINI